MTTDVSPQGLYFPADITPEQLFQAMGKLRRAAMDEIERLLAFLDSTEPDADLEENGDREPPLGWTDMEARYGALSAPAGEDEDGADAEPSLGFATGGWMPEHQRQEGRAFHLSADGGQDLEDEHCGAEPEDDSEPDVDSEPSLGWTDNPKQGSAAWLANHLGATDLEQGVGPVRKKRPASLTGGKVVQGRSLQALLPTISMKECSRILV